MTRRRFPGELHHQPPPGLWLTSGLVTRTGDQRTEDGGQKKPFSVKPDFVFPKLKTAVFVDGCFWHGCPRHATQPKTNAQFWRNKIATNKARDRRVNCALRGRGWTVLRIWEHELRRKDESKLLRHLKTHVT